MEDEQMKMFSQIGQDHWVLENLANKRNGIFIEVGAADGKYLSNTFLLERDYNWTGLCIEPSSEFANLSKNRLCEVSNALLLGVEGMEVEYLEDELNDHKKLYSGIRSYIDKFDVKGKSFHRITTTLNHLLNRLEFPRSVDYLSVDTEGTEYEILKGIDFDRYHISLITVEHNWIEPKRSDIRSLLFEKGYQLDVLADSQFEDWYIHRSLLTSTESLYFKKSGYFKSNLISKLRNLEHTDELTEKLKTKESIIQSQIALLTEKSNHIDIFKSDIELKISELEEKTDQLNRLAHFINELKTKLSERESIISRLKNDLLQAESLLKTQQNLLKDQSTEITKFKRAQQAFSNLLKEIEIESVLQIESLLKLGLRDPNQQGSDRKENDHFTNGIDEIKEPEDPEQWSEKKPYKSQSLTDILLNVHNINKLHVAWIQDQQAKLVRKEIVIRNLLKVNGDLQGDRDRIMNSLSWKIISKITQVPSHLLTLRRKAGAGRNSESNRLEGSQGQDPIPPDQPALFEKGETLRQSKFHLASPEGKNYRKGLSALVIPCTIKDEREIVENLELWDDEKLLPYQITPENSKKIPLVFFVNHELSLAFEKSIIQAFSNTTHICHQFSELEFFYCQLSGEDDTYETDYAKKVGEQGYKSGPNNQFFMAMQYFANYGDYIFYMEPDCYPIRKDWLGRLTEIVHSHGPFWIMGSIYRGLSNLDPKIQTHINGNAIYAVGDPKFQLFVAETLYPFLVKVVRDEYPWLAYDCAFNYYFHKALSSKDPNRWKEVRALYPKFVATDYIQNHSGFVEFKEKRGAKITEIIAFDEATYIVHGRHFSLEVNQLLIAKN